MSFGLLLSMDGHERCGRTEWCPGDGGTVAAARFQVMASVSRAVPAPRAPLRDRQVRRLTSGEPEAGPTRVFVWYLLAANNRRVAMGTATHPQSQACLDSIQLLLDGLPRAVGVLVQLAPARWEWRIRVDGADQARSGHAYPRRVRAQLACDAFVVLAVAAAAAEVQRVYR